MNALTCDGKVRKKLARHEYDRPMTSFLFSLSRRKKKHIVILIE